MMPDTIASASPDADHAHATGGSSVNQFRFGGTKDYVFGAIIGVSILVNALSLWAINNDAKEQRLKQYDLDDFKSREYAQLKGQVAMQDKVINMLTVRKECMK